MSVDDFVKIVRHQVFEACGDLRIKRPEKIEFSIKVNEKGEVCGPNDFCSAIIGVEI